MDHNGMIEVLQAHGAGKRIQCRLKNETVEWRDVAIPQWNFHEFEYRVKPEPREWDLRGAHVYEVGGAGSINAVVNVGYDHIRVREVLPDQA